MNNLTIAAQTIKDNVSAQDVGMALGLEIRNGRCKCPIHGGGDYNCVLYKGDRGYYCHVCKSGGDVIRFVREYNKMSFSEAVGWLNRTFSLGLELSAKIDPEKQKRAEIALQRRKRVRELRMQVERTKYDLWLCGEKLTEKLEEARDEHRPRTYGAWNEAFCTAVKLIPYMQRMTEECEMNCIEVKKNG